MYKIELVSTIQMRTPQTLVFQNLQPLNTGTAAKVLFGGWGEIMGRGADGEGGGRVILAVDGFWSLPTQVILYVVCACLTYRFDWGWL